jgi:hypothetical protein
MTCLPRWRATILRSRRPAPRTRCQCPAIQPFLKDWDHRFRRHETSSPDTGHVDISEGPVFVSYATVDMSRIHRCIPAFPWCRWRGPSEDSVVLICCFVVEDALPMPPDGQYAGDSDLQISSRSVSALSLARVFLARLLVQVCRFRCCLRVSRKTVWEDLVTTAMLMYSWQTQNIRERQKQAGKITRRCL